MLCRRSLIAAAAASGFAAPALAAGDAGFQSFLVGVRAEARRDGIAAATLDRALTGIRPNQKVLDRENHQPEFTLSWAQYRALVVTSQRIVDGRAAWQRNRALLEAVRARYGVDPGVILGIWGLESSFGAKTGDFNVVESLATLAWSSHRGSFFRGELIAALRILDNGDIAPGRMTGSYAGAMGQPQFMPSSYLRYAVDFDGSGRRDIWTSTPDVLGSIANYLARSGWQQGQPACQQVVLPTGVAASDSRDDRRPVTEWARQGVRPAVPGQQMMALPAAVLVPDGAGGEAFLAYPNFAAIRRYNPSDFYALAVGLIGQMVTA